MQAPLVDVEAICDQAFNELEAGHLPRSLDLILRARALAPRTARVHYLLGLYYTDTRQVKLSLDAFEEALRLDPANAKAHNNRGSALEQLGRAGDAEAAFRQALTLDTRLAQPYINLGHLLEQRGARQDAAAVYAQAIDNGLDREMFEQYRAAAIGLQTDASPATWIRATFDNFAPAFDQKLRSLGYRVPEDLADMLLPVLPARVDILDLGCGTGLCGMAFASRKSRLVGVDLSEKMLQQAKARGVYDEVVVAEATEYLKAACPRPSTSSSLPMCSFISVRWKPLRRDGTRAELRRHVRLLHRGAVGARLHAASDGSLRALARLRSPPSARRIRRRRAPTPTVVRKEADRPLAGRLYVLTRI